MKAVGIIPARMGSSRFPGKPLALINGVPMLGHVYQRARRSPLLGEVYVATCDEQIRAYCEGIGAPCVMTDSAHVRASDRTAEAVDTIERKSASSIDLVVMIQGDEPMLQPEMIREAITPLLDNPSEQVVNLMAPLRTAAEQDDSNEVKVVVDRNGYALYFSREPIPSPRLYNGMPPAQKQVCIIPFRRSFLRRFVALEPTVLEQIESVDMLRVLEHGFRVRMVATRFETYSVDTPDDLTIVANLLREDPLARSYS